MNVLIFFSAFTVALCRDSLIFVQIEGNLSLPTIMSTRCTNGTYVQLRTTTKNQGFGLLETAPVDNVVTQTVSARAAASLHRWFVNCA